MRNYEVQVINPMVRSTKDVVTAKNLNDAKCKASKIFSFNGDWKYIIAKEVI